MLEQFSRALRDRILHIPGRHLGRHHEREVLRRGRQGADRCRLAVVRAELDERIEVELVHRHDPRQVGLDRDSR